MKSNEFVRMTDLGNLTGRSSHAVGKRLTDAGLRANGRPTPKAFDQRLVKTAATERGTGYFYLWHQEKTLPFLGSGIDGEAGP